MGKGVGRGNPLQTKMGLDDTICDDQIMFLSLRLDGKDNLGGP
jgi:hypothetical protein